MAHEMNHNGPMVVVLEKCQIALPQGSVPSTTLPLTFLDVPFITCPPIQRIFFYEFPHPTHHFLQSPLPALKHSLSNTLQHFFPFASNLIYPPQPHEPPYIRYLPGDSLPFTVVESSSMAENFHHLVSNSPQDFRNWHSFVPTLPSPRTEEDGTRVIPLMAIQVTILPNFAFTICIKFNHAAGDGRSLHHFIKHWACLCQKTEDSVSPESEHTLPLPFHDRNIVKDPKGLKLMNLQELQQYPPPPQPTEFAGNHVLIDNVRAAFILSRERIEKLKKFIILKGKHHQVSTFVVTCSLLWVCMIKSEQRKDDDNCEDELCYFMFPADGRDRPELSLPSTYFGNCLIACIVAMKRCEMVGENGIVEVANGIDKEIRNWKNDPLRNAENPLSYFMELIMSGQSFLSVSGSPRHAPYETDFGWGKPKKSQTIYNDPGHITLADSRDTKGAVEVGLVLERLQMNHFFNILEQQFLHIEVCE